MNAQEYRRAIKQIRWSDEKRAAVEAALKEKAPAAAIAAEDWPEQTHAHTVEVTHETVKRTEAFEMKQIRTRRFLLIGLAAAILATGGAIAAVAGYAAKHHNKKQEITWDNGTKLNLTNEECDFYSFSTDVNYLHQVYYGGNSVWRNPAVNFTVTDSGCFYYKEERDHSTGKKRYTLMYKDNDSGQAVPVCARANCKHDGSEYCTASTDVYAPSHLEYYDGYLYSMTTKFLHPEHRNMNECDFDLTGYTNEDSNHGNKTSTIKYIPPEECRQVLIRYAPDGTKIEELHDFGNGKGVSNCFYHRGYLWCVVQLQNSGESLENELANVSTVFVNGGWQLWGYELATGKTVCLFNGMPREDINQINASPSYLTPVGDYIYFSRIGIDWSGSQGALNRFSLLTGKEETVLRSDVVAFPLTQHKIMCKEQRTVNSRTVINTYIYDLDTGEKSASVPAFSQDYEYDGSEYQLVNDTILTDQYIITSGYPKSYLNRTYGVQTDDKESEITATFILDHDFNVLNILDGGISYTDYIDNTDTSIDSLDGASAALPVCVYRDKLYLLDVQNIHVDDFECSFGISGDFSLRCASVQELATNKNPMYEIVYSSDSVNGD